MSIYFLQSVYTTKLWFHLDFRLLTSDSVFVQHRCAHRGFALPSGKKSSEWWVCLCVHASTCMCVLHLLVTSVSSDRFWKQNSFWACGFSILSASSQLYFVKVKGHVRSWEDKNEETLQNTFYHSRIQIPRKFQVYDTVGQLCIADTTLANFAFEFNVNIMRKAPEINAHLVVCIWLHHMSTHGDALCCW